MVNVVKRLGNKLKQLLSLQSSLRAILDSKGFTNSPNEHFTELIPKVGQISEKAYAVEGTITLVSNSTTLVINNLPQKPTEVGLLCKSLRDASLVTTTSEVADYVVLDMLALFEDSTANSVTVDKITVTRTQETSGNWRITLSTTEEYQFKAGHVYTWVSLSHIVAG